MRRPISAFVNWSKGLDAIVWEADAATGQFAFVSQQAQSILGYPASRWIEEQDFWITVIHPEDREQTLKSFRAALKARQIIRSSSERSPQTAVSYGWRSGRV